MKAKDIVSTIVKYVLLAVFLFGIAGDITWIAGWVCFGILSGYAIIAGVILSKHDPGVIEERQTMIAEDQKGWDKVFTVGVGILSMAWMVFIPLDAVRFGWSPPIPVWAQVVGAVLMAAGFYLVFLTMMENTYLSRTVRIQDERGHKVIDTGPYAIVRHPMYVGVIVIFPAFALLLGSGWGTLMGLILTLSFPVRIIFEEQTLREELVGYREYTERVRYRLIPRVW